MSMLAGNVAMKLAFDGMFLGIYLWLHQFRLFDIGVDWSAALLDLVAIDFVYYWFHRASHRVRILWAVHVNHHSSELMNFGTALRQPWLNRLVRPSFFWVLPIIGFHPFLTLTVGSIATIYGFWTHTEQIRTIGPLGWIFVSPSHHRVHHGSNPEYIDRNYGNLLIIWDRLFGTFAREDAPVVYGLRHNIDSYNPLTIAFHDWSALLRGMRQAPSVSVALALAFKPPGWTFEPDVPDQPDEPDQP